MRKSPSPANHMGGPTRQAPTPTIEKRLDQAVGLCLLVAAGAVVGALCGYLLVWGGEVVPAWAVGAALLVVSLVLAAVRSIVRKQRKGATGEVPPRRRSAWWSALAVLTALCAGFLGLADFVFDAGYKVLQPSGPGFCQAAVREDSFLFGGGGELYAVGFGGIGRAVSSWTADDGYNPVASGSYDFTWTSEGALLRVHGGSFSPVWPAQHEFDCR